VEVDVEEWGGGKTVFAKTKENYNTEHSDLSTLNSTKLNEALVGFNSESYSLQMPSPPIYLLNLELPDKLRLLCIDILVEIWT
jgi:hypothetical protein